ncbi:MAG TPA: hypothetical protein VGV12_04515 [Gemmatimonadales bacterium]|nr:hypothetical protein [Gemmatimonadales bacterium]
MHRYALLLVAILTASGARVAGAQATGTTTFNAPYRAFQRSEIGVLMSFPDGGGTAIEGAYRYASGKFDIGFKAGFLNTPGPGNTVFLAGAEARERVITHTIDFPLDGALVVGAGGNFVSGNSTLLFPVGLSLGRRIDPQGSTVSIIPYAQPTMFLIAGNHVTNHVQFTLGLGSDFRLSRAFDVRVSAGLGDVEGVSIGAVWVH